MTRRPSNIAASVRARLLTRAKSEQRPFDELLQYYAMERFLYRVSVSEHAERFVLKGGLMLQLWADVATRSTKDIDFSSCGPSTVDDLVGIVRACLQVAVEDDGIRFYAESVTGKEIRIEAKYPGVRLLFQGGLGTARLNLQVDVGFGDVITPDAQWLTYPTLLDHPEPRLWGYTPETTVAEKFEAMVTLDMANTRMKDFFDIWMLAQHREFSGVVLGEAIHATFARRDTPLPTSPPVALTADFHEDPDKQKQWKAYLRKNRLAARAPADLAAVVQQIRAFVYPVVASPAPDEKLDALWPPGGPWRSR